MIISKPHIRHNAITTSFCALLSLLLISCVYQSASVRNISQPELLDRVNNNNVALLLDVRSPEEFSTGHIKGAVNITHAELPYSIDEIKSFMHEEVVVYCNSGRRAASAVKTLQKEGFTNILLLPGNIKAWKESNLPLVMN